MSRSIMTLLLLLTPAVCVTSASAGWPTDPSANVPVATIADCDNFPMITADGAGGTFVAWSDYRTGPALVFAQHFDPSGQPLWPANGIALSSSVGGQCRPQIIPDGSGGAIVAWGEFCPVRAQRVDGAGALLWGSDGVQVTSAISGPKLASDGNGGAIIAWSESDAAFHAQVHVQRINGSGAVAWEAGGVPLTSGSGSWYGAQVVPDGAGGAIIAWSGHDQGAADDIFAQRVDAQGNRLWGIDNVAVCSAPRNQQYAALIADGVGGAIVAWQDSRAGDNWYDYLDIYAQRLNATGAALWSPNGKTICTAPGWQEAFDLGTGLVPDGSGGAVLAWADHRSDSTHVYAQHVDSNGSSQWGENGIGLFSTAEAQGIPSLAPDGSGGAVVVWTDHRTGQFDVYGQHLAADGSEVWTHGGTPFSTAAADQHGPSVVWDGVSNAVAVWDDERSGGVHVFAQGVQLGQPTAGTPGTVPSQSLSLSLVGPNPILGHGEIAVRLALPAPAAASLDLVDAMGRRIAWRDLRSLGLGTFTMSIGSERGLSPGVYFVRLHQGPSVRTLRVAVLE